MTAEVFESLRPHLFGLAYRALGSRADAEDVVQDAYIRWQDTDTSKIESPKAFLTTVVARLSLDQLKAARRKREEYFGVWLPEPIMTGASPEDSAAMAESLSTAFLFVLESLGPDERVAFLLHDIFGNEYAEIAEALETSEANSRQLVSRARKHVRDRRPRFHIARETQQAMLREFLDACLKNDLSRLMTMLRDDAVTFSDGGGKAAAAVNPVEGANRVARFFAGIAQKVPADFEWRIEESSGVPSLLLISDGQIVSLITFDLDEQKRIAWVLVQRNPDKLPKLPLN